MTITIILLIVAAILFLLATFGVGGRINLVAGGLASVVLAYLLPMLGFG